MLARREIDESSGRASIWLRRIKAMQTLGALERRDSRDYIPNNRHLSP